MGKPAPRIAPPVSALARLRQLAQDIDRAILSGNWALVTQATALLAPVLEECQRSPASAREIAPIQKRLDACERKLTEAMSRTDEELRHLRQGKRRLLALAVVPAASRRPPARYAPITLCGASVRVPPAFFDLALTNAPL